MAKRKKIVLVLAKPKSRAKFRPLPPGVTIAKPRRAQKLAEIEAKAGRRTKRAVAKVVREAYTFIPDVMIAVAVDYKHQRIMVKLVEGDTPHPETLVKIESAAKKELLIGRMKRGWGLGRDCEHPRSRRKKMRYCAGSEHGVICFKMAEFCTGCGTLLSHVESKEFTATLGERIAVQMEAEYPNIVRRAT